MSKKYTFKASNGEGKSFEMDYANDVQNEEDNKAIGKLLEEAEPSWDFFWESAKYTRSVFYFFGILLLFFIVNFGLFIYGTYAAFMAGIGVKHLFPMLFLLAVGIGFTSAASYEAYKYVAIDLVRVIYVNLTSFFEKICAIVVDKSFGFLSGKKALEDKKLSKQLDFAKILHDQYASIPLLLRKSLLFVLRRIPLVGMVSELSEQILSGDQETASQQLHQRMDTFITEEIFGLNSLTQVWKFLVFNLLIGIGIIYYFLK